MRPNPPRPSWRGYRALAVWLDEIAMFEDDEPEDAVAAYAVHIRAHRRLRPRPASAHPPTDDIIAAREKEKDYEPPTHSQARGHQGMAPVCRIRY